MKKLLLSLVCLFSLAGTYAQTDNYGLHFKGTGQSVNCGRIPSLEGASQFTIEAWINAQTWTKDAQVLSYGSDFSLKLGEANKIGVTIGGVTVTAKDNSFIAGKWNMLTISYNGNEIAENRVSVFTNGIPVQQIENAASLPIAISTDSHPFIIGNGLIGWTDEIRIWKKALIQANIIHRTTISSYNDNYGDLAAYYKCDQFTSPGLVDYSNEQHHGKFIPDNTIREKVTDNANLLYHTITGYVEFPTIAAGNLNDKQQLLMCNDVALLSEVRVNAETGEVSCAHPTLTAELTNVEYATTFTAPKSPTGAYTTHLPGNVDKLNRETRDGILKFKGQNAQMNLGDLKFSGNKVTFHTWFYVNNWTPGASLFEKSNTEGDEVSLKMGENDGEFIFTVSALLQGQRYTEVYPFETTFRDSNPPNDSLKTCTTGEFQYWHFLSFVFDGTKEIPVSMAFDAFVQGWPPTFVSANRDGIMQNGVKMPTDSKGTLQRKNTSLPGIAGKNMLVGKNMDGYMDEIAFWGTDRTTAQRHVTDAINAGLGIGNTGTYYTIGSLIAYYRVLDQESACINSTSFKELLKILIHNQLDGNRGCKLRLSILPAGTRGWMNMLQDNTIRPIAARNLAKFIESNPADYKFAGLDFDFEWSTSQTVQDNYTLFIQELKKEMKPGQTLSIAINGTMPWTYRFPAKAYNLVDFFTAEDYGPFASKFTFDVYKSSLANYKAYLPTGKVLPSIGLYGVGDVKDQLASPAYNTFASLIPNEETNRIPKPGTSFYYNFCGIKQSRDRAKYALDNNFGGFMFYHMSCDVLPSEPKSLTRAVAQILPSNHEPIVEVPNEIVEAPNAMTNFMSMKSSATDKSTMSIYTDGSKLIIEASEPEVIVISTTEGVIIRNLTTRKGLNEFDLPQGIYIVNNQKIVVQ